MNRLLMVPAVLFALCSLPARLQASDFRASTWGDSMEAVRSVETAQFHHQGADELAFMDSEIDGISGGILYLFEHGRLVRGLYVSRSDYAAGEGVLADYQRMRAHFDEILGVEGDEESRWIGVASEKDDPDLRLAALVANRVRVSTSWTLERTQVNLIMTGKDGGVFLRAVFQPPA